MIVAALWLLVIVLYAGLLLMHATRRGFDVVRVRRIERAHVEAAAENRRRAPMYWMPESYGNVQAAPGRIGNVISSMGHAYAGAMSAAVGGGYSTRSVEDGRHQDH